MVPLCFSDLCSVSSIHHCWDTVPEIFQKQCFESNLSCRWVVLRPTKWSNVQKFQWNNLCWKYELHKVRGKMGSLLVAFCRINMLHAAMFHWLFTEMHLSRFFWILVLSKCELTTIEEITSRAGNVVWIFWVKNKSLQSLSVLLYHWSQICYTVMYLSYLFGHALSVRS